MKAVGAFVAGVLVGGLLTLAICQIGRYQMAQSSNGCVAVLDSWKREIISSCGGVKQF